MFIQCQSCQTTFKIDEDKIPQKDSAVRCTTCSELIPLSPEEQGELLKKSPKKFIVCDSCGTQYSVPLSSITQETTKAKCGKCGNLFSISESDDNDLSDESPSAKAYEEDLGTDDIGLDNIDIPEGSEIEVDDLFGDVSAKENKGKNKGKNADEEYLESIKLTNGEEDEVLDDDLGINEISKDHKYKIFLKPKGKKKKGKKDESADSWPEAEDDLALDDSEKKANKKKPKKKKDTKPGKSKRSVFLWLIWGLIVIVLAALAYVVIEMQKDQYDMVPQTESFDSKSKIAILEPLNGDYYGNNNFEKQIYVLSGQVYNLYGEDTTLSKIEIEGYLYPKGKTEKISSVSFAGETLDDRQLKSLKKAEIESILTNQSKDSDSLKEFGSNEIIDFQVVFFSPPESINLEKLGAKIVKYNRKTKKSSE
ncbi:MAG: zinc-ribbon domain-containing protein [Proteobacteria bacterium]|nr:zinc-ribbon domain-containing protein [Pseudomonadota bacterium]